MRVYEFLLARGSRYTPYIEDNEKRIQAATRSGDRYFVPGNGGYHNALSARPWDADDETPDIECEKATPALLLAALVHSECFLDGMLDDLEESDFAESSAAPDAATAPHVQRELEAALQLCIHLGKRG